MSIENKKLLARKQIKDKHGCDNTCARCNKIFGFIDKMDDSKIPFQYWFSKMEDFKGPDILKNTAEEYNKCIKNNYYKGKSICLIGGQGVGKTYSVCCILKKALKNNFSCYYTTALDLMNDLISGNELRQKLKEIDFLMIDELDSRFFPSTAQKELFGSLYESVFRNRSQNSMPTIMCSNETNNLLNVFSGQSVQSIASLHNQYLDVIYVAGIDFRKRIKDESIIG